MVKKFAASIFIVTMLLPFISPRAYAADLPSMPVSIDMQEAAGISRKYGYHLYHIHYEYLPISGGDFPQRIYHSEPNPYAPGEAHGYLDLAGFVRGYPGTREFYVHYAGYMAYYA